MPTSDIVTVPWTRLGTTDVLTVPETWPAGSISAKWAAPASPRQPSPVPGFCIGPAGEPWVAFVETAYDASLVKAPFGPYVWKYTGGAWVKVDGPASDGAVSNMEITMVSSPFYTGGGSLGIDGNPEHISYDLNELQLAYDGTNVYLTSREEVAGPTADGSSPSTTLANYVRTVWMHDGSSWTRTELPNAGSGSHWLQSWSGVLKADADDPGHPTICWVEKEIQNHAGDFTTVLHKRLYCAKWDGSAWALIGGAAVTSDWGSYWVEIGDMVIDKNGRPHIILGTIPTLSAPGGPPIRIFSWSGSAWVETQLDLSDIGLSNADYYFGSSTQVRIPGGGSQLAVGGQVLSEKHGPSDDLHQVLISVRRFGTSDTSDPRAVGFVNYVFEWNASTRSAQLFNGTAYRGEAPGGNEQLRILQPEDSRNLSWFLDGTTTSWSLVAYDAICQGWWIPSNIFDLPSFGSYRAQTPTRVYRDGENFYVVMPWYTTTPSSGINVYSTPIDRHAHTCQRGSHIWQRF